MVIIEVPKIVRLKAWELWFLAWWPTQRICFYFSSEIVYESSALWVAGGDDVKNRLRDTLLQNGSDAFPAARAGWEMFFSSCENTKILNFSPLFLLSYNNIKLRLTPPPPRKSYQKCFLKRWRN